jgi:hypothetical protein
MIKHYIAFLILSVFGYASDTLAFVSGYDGQYTSADPFHKRVTLIDQNGVAFDLRDGFYRIRNSNGAASLTFMPDAETYQILHFNTGFANGILDNYYINGAANGQMVDLQANTNYRVISEWTNRQTQRCSLNCGYDYCGRQISCTGYQDIEVRNQVTNKNFTIQFLDNSMGQRELLGTFFADLGNSSNSITTHVSSCRITSQIPIGLCRIDRPGRPDRPGPGPGRPDRPFPGRR